MPEIDESKPFSDTLRQAENAIGDTVYNSLLKLFDSIRQPSDRKPSSDVADLGRNIAQGGAHEALFPYFPKAGSGDSPSTDRDPEEIDPVTGKKLKNVKAPNPPPQLAATNAVEAWNDFEKSLSDAIDEIALDMAGRSGAPIKPGAGLTRERAVQGFALVLAAALKRKIIPALRARFFRMFVRRWTKNGSKPIPGAERPKPQPPVKGGIPVKPPPPPAPVEVPSKPMKGKEHIKRGGKPGAK